MDAPGYHHRTTTRLRNDRRHMEPVRPRGPRKVTTGLGSSGKRQQLIARARQSPVSNQRRLRPVGSAVPEHRRHPLHQHHHFGHIPVCGAPHPHGVGTVAGRREGDEFTAGCLVPSTQKVHGVGYVLPDARLPSDKVPLEEPAERLPGPGIGEASGRA